jgi:hypothetical protein
MKHPKRKHSRGVAHKTRKLLREWRAVLVDPPVKGPGGEARGQVVIRGDPLGQTMRPTRDWQNARSDHGGAQVSSVASAPRDIPSWNHTSDLVSAAR